MPSSTEPTLDLSQSPSVPATQLLDVGMAATADLGAVDDLQTLAGSAGPGTGAQRERSLPQTTMPEGTSLDEAGRARLRTACWCIGVGWVAAFLLHFAIYLTWNGPDFSTEFGLTASHRDFIISFAGLSALGVISSAVVLGITQRFPLKHNEMADLGAVFGIITCLLLDLIDAQFPLRLATAWRPPLVTPWLLFFPLMVPNTLKRTVGAVVVATLCLPLSWLIWFAIEGTPLPDFQIFASVAVPMVFTGVLAVAPSVMLARMERQLRASRKRIRELGSYVLEDRLGAGGMGEVWRARHRMLARPAAVKLIRSEQLADDAERLRVALTRFEREARVTAALRNPHTVEVYDYGQLPNGTLYYVMELLEGLDLEELVATYGPVPPARVVFLLDQIAESLAEAHAGGLVHRDIKPANLYICRYGGRTDFVKVFDFGLVKPVDKLIEGAAEDSALASQEDGDLMLTRPGRVSGTAAFMSPEAARAELQDPRSDLYALGGVAWWLLSGQLVFPGSNALAQLMSQATERPDVRRLRTAQPIPPELEEIVLSLLAKERDERPQSADELRQMLRSVPLRERWDDRAARAWWERHRTTRA